MKFESLQRRVRRAEHILEGRIEQTRTSSQSLRSAWREGWTPGRIVLAGLVSGFLTGRAEPLRSLTGARWLQMITSVSGMLASLQAAASAEQAETASDEARAETQAQGAAANSAPAPAQTPDPFAGVAPRPAEAATEMSEH
ncbi:hypothetical protein [Pseudoxanthomonas dokdonensis]|uniref:Protein sip-5 n=1 Tax=Pseudoxanthomonas dokdonensis TaxID=344882 RepID=A0A0R0CYD1_9GAMM|nr:hypothetical protein [Pseudoxanthomonas dokdonensis]KRG71554.1 hypothetical protein ABB29_01945 [Pseudoxanthomonas dokdonensis]